MESEEEMKWEFECAQRLVGMPSKNSGNLVITKTGLTGRTYNHEEHINGKVRVYLSNGKKMLCSPQNLKLTGFID